MNRKYFLNLVLVLLLVFLISGCQTNKQKISSNQEMTKTKQTTKKEIKVKPPANLTKDYLIGKTFSGVYNQIIEKTEENTTYVNLKTDIKFIANDKIVIKDKIGYKTYANEDNSLIDEDNNFYDYELEYYYLDVQDNKIIIKFVADDDDNLDMLLIYKDGKLYFNKEAVKNRVENLYSFFEDAKVEFNGGDNMVFSLN